MSRLENKWWYIVVVSILTVLATRYVMDMAGVPAAESFSMARFLLHFFCFVGLWRCFSFIGWLVALAWAPALAKPE